MSSGTSRKRGRRESESATMAALDLPNIPNVPMAVVPEFVHALRVATKFYAKCHDQPYYDYKEGSSSSSNNDEHTHDNNTENENGEERGLVLNSWMQRMEAATESTTTPESQEVQERKERMHDATGRWLESVKHFAKSAQHREKLASSAAAAAGTAADNPGNEGRTEQLVRISVPYACFLYIWDLQQSHDRIAVRRSAVYLTGLLLQRSKDCRFHLEQGDHLDQWMKSTLLDYRPTKSKDDLPLLQSEANYWLNSLVEQGYAHLYPKIRVACQRLRQNYPHLQTTTIDATSSMSTFTSMADCRRIRDIALEYGHKEVVQIQRWIDRAHECLEILVPRVGVVEESPSGTTTCQADEGEKEEKMNDTKNGRAGDEEGDEDIDWEDGGEDDFDDGTSMTLPNFEHLSAVERTLAAMESAGGLQGGEIEIDFRSDPNKNEDEDFQPVGADAEEERAAALAKFLKCVSRLSRRHMPRLSVWLEGLRNADNLVTSTNGKSLVSLPSDAASRRSQLVQRLTELKQTISSVLKSAVKLDINTGTGNESTETHANRLVDSEATSLPSLRLSSNTSNNQTRENLMAAVRRQKPKSRATSSNRIQIKFRSR